jgi:hypothetical protein
MCEYGGVDVLIFATFLDELVVYAFEDDYAEKGVFAI